MNFDGHSAAIVHGACRQSDPLENIDLVAFRPSSPGIVDASGSSPGAMMLVLSSPVAARLAATLAEVVAELDQAQPPSPDLRRSVRAVKP